MADYNGLTRNQWPGTWSPSSDHPIVLDTEIRGGLRYVSGDSGDRLSDITGQRLQDGMVVYVENGYTEGSVTYQSGQYYKFNVLSGESRDSSTGVLPNDSDNWEFFKPDVSGLSYDSSSGLLTISTNDGNTISDSINLNPFSTTDLSEGSNLYYTTARADSDAKNAVSATDAGGDGSFSYNSGTGVFTYTGPSASEARAHMVAGTGVTYDSSTGIISIGQPVGITDSVNFSHVHADSAAFNYVNMIINDSAPTYREGALWYDRDYHTLNYFGDDSNVTHNLGLEEHQRVFNNTGSTIAKGAPLYFSGNYTSGSFDVPTVGLADATDVNAYNAQGIAAGPIPNNSYGYCLTAGQLFNVDTSHLNAGTNFFVGLGPGLTQNASPLYPNFPMCLGWVVSSDATNGVLLVNQQNHSVRSFRVQTSAHIGEDLQVDGNLTVLGTQTTVGQSNVTQGAPFYRLNEGDAIGEANTTFTGSGLDDAFFAGHFKGTTSQTYYVRIDGVGTGPGGVDTFEVALGNDSNFASPTETKTAITGNPQLIHSIDNISVEFGSTTGHDSGDRWSGTASPINVDTGFFTNRNTGTSGVGYTHMGFYFDVSDEKWKVIDEYDSTPTGIINVTDSALGILVATSFEGDLTGDVTGNADTASIATNVTASANNSNNETVYLTFVDGATGSQGIETDTGLTYNPSTGLITTTSVTASGDVTVDSAGGFLFDVSDKALEFGDNYKASFGDDGDLEIYHNGSASFIKDGGTGQLRVLSNQFRVKNATDNETLINALQNGTVELYYDNTKRFETTDSGVLVTGQLVADSATISGDVTVDSAGGFLFDVSEKELKFGDNYVAEFGDGGDLRIFHNGTHSFIRDQGTGQLRLTTNILHVTNGANSETQILANAGGSVDLYYANSERFRTTDSGVLVTGQLVADSATFTNVTGTLQTAAQTNITSVGNLTALRVDGEIDARGGITDNGGNLILQASSGNVIRLRNHTGNNIISVTDAGAAQLNYTTSTKLITTDSGISVTGSILADSASFSGPVHIDNDGTDGPGSGLRVADVEFYDFGTGDPTFRNANTNKKTVLRVLPNGTGITHGGYPTNHSSAFEFFGRDYHTDATTYHNFRIIGREDSDYIIDTSLGSAANNKGIRFNLGSRGGTYTGAENILVLSGDSDNGRIGNVGIGTADPTSKLHVAGTIRSTDSAIFGGDGSTDGIIISDGLIDMRTGTGNVSKIKFYCEVNNAHFQTLQAQPHSAASSAVITLPQSTGTLARIEDVVDSAAISSIITADVDQAFVNALNVDADTLDGIDGASFLRSNASDTYSGGQLNIQTHSAVGHYWGLGLKYDGGWRFTNDSSMGMALRNNATAGYWHMYIADSAGTANGMVGNSLQEYRFGGTDGEYIKIGGNTVWHAGNDGTGSGLDADLLDGVQGTSFLRSDAADAKTSGDLTFNDDISAFFGTGSDLKIHHQSSSGNSFIQETGSGSLKITASQTHILNAANNTYLAKFIQEGAVELNYDGTKRFETTDSGATVTGSLLADSATFNNINIGAVAGGIKVAATGFGTDVLNMSNHNIIGVNNLRFSDPGADEGISWNGGNTKIYEAPNNLSNAAGNLQVIHGSTRRLTVDNLGIEVSGRLDADSATINGGSIFFDSAGNSARLQLTHAERQSSDVLQIQTDDGYILIGPQNNGYAHIETDRPKFYFQQRIMLGENHLTSYNGDLILSRVENATHRVVISDSDVQIHNGVLRIDPDTAPSSTANKLYNVGGTLFWNGTDVTSGGGGGGAVDSATTISIISDTVDNAFVDALNVNAATVTATANNTTNETVYLTFVDGATGEQGIETDTFLSYNPATNTLTLGSGGDALTIDDAGTITANGNTLVLNSTIATALQHNGSTKLQTTSSGVTVTGLLSATTKSFDIEHPTKEGMRLRYASLEGPENGVYVRGRLKGNNTIELPDYWTGLVDEDTITVNLTAIGKHQEIYVEDIGDNKVIIGGEDINCFYTVYGERKDVDQLVVEY